MQSSSLRLKQHKFIFKTTYFLAKQVASALRSLPLGKSQLEAYRLGGEIGCHVFSPTPTPTGLGYGVKVWDKTGKNSHLQKFPYCCSLPQILNFSVLSVNLGQ